jgi:hypothetical protein
VKQGVARSFRLLPREHMAPRFCSKLGDLARESIYITRIIEGYLFIFALALIIKVIYRAISQTSIVQCLPIRPPSSTQM